MLQIPERLELVLALLKKEFELSKLQKKIGKEVQYTYTLVHHSVLQWRYILPDSVVNFYCALQEWFKRIIKVVYVRRQ